MRFGFLDSLRGMAVIWMIIFHTCYDMRVFGMIDWNFSEGFWFAFPRFIAFTFLFCVGVSLYFVHHPRINWGSLRKRTLKLGFASAAVSVGTYLLFPHQWVFFGTLHCILAGSLVGVSFVNHKGLSWVTLGIILILQYVMGFDIKWVSSIVQKPSMDFIPIYPWVWVILLGSLMAPILSKNRHIGGLKAPQWLRFLSSHSLKIYLLHQPIIYGALWVIKAFV